ncbi:cytoplasmic protein [Lentinula aciculospora]|uniref:GPN-loop GTPase 2 n=1 Tax=Lentinula aciculospora TaxID=153920 RepID=A0A9W8ZUU0_9AGAR|nr:cytoplasmic protein [Lentinula aciculospora]KAJ4467073.1 cytoplasmic protein [Lentinula aciculospora]
MPFGEIVCGAPGSGKSTYCHGKHQLFTALQRPIYIVNLDPANDNIPYPCSIDISELITLQEVMDEHGLGPNGGMLYCMEYLEKNFDWLEGRLAELGKEDSELGDVYVLFDLPGQVELSTNHESVKRIVDMLRSKCEFRLAAVHLCDAHYVTDAAKYISVLLLSLRTMLQLELPHINVLSKIDLLGNYGDLDFNLDFYTEVQDLSYLENSLSTSLSPRFQALNMAIISLIEDYSLVGFETLAVEDKSSMLHLTHAIDRATGYVFIPRPSNSSPSANSNSNTNPKAASNPSKNPQPEGTIDESHKPLSAQPNEYGLFSSAVGPLKNALGNLASGGGSTGTRFAGVKDVYDVRDVQERWLDAKDAWDAYEKREWRKEGEMLRDEVARMKVTPTEGQTSIGGSAG